MIATRETQMYQIELFETPSAAVAKNKKCRDVNAEAKHLLDKHGISDAPRELKALIAAKLMSEHFPEMHTLLMQSLATTMIKP